MFQNCETILQISLSDAKITPASSLQPKMLMDSEFDKIVGDFSPWLPNQYLYPISLTGQAVLRYISEGTRYHQIRLAFGVRRTTRMVSLLRISPLDPGHPIGLYQIRLRASTELSSSFTLPRTRSSGFRSLAYD